MKAYRELKFVCIACHCLLIDRKKKKPFIFAGNELSIPFFMVYVSGL